MSQLDIQAPVGDWVVQHPGTSRLFESLKIDYCCGGAKSLQQACQDRNIDPQQVYRQLTDAVSESDDQRADWASFPLADLCDHIEQTHHAYLKEELPRLARITTKVAAVHGPSDPSLVAIRDLFERFRAELESHTFKEEQVLFPAIRLIERAGQPPSFPFGTIANPIRMMEHEHDDAGGALEQIREFTHDYAVPPQACNTYRAMLHGLEELETDLHQHVHKENHHLFPKAIELESARRNKGE